ncbi:hypothetical protein NA57DRAFT_51045 [Rhizodiscina lignyota]|uniref:Uncharacterized protein n=1 Tax=Rhizodiscina lignyota TaxID=1504668 RepID=A0A9P4ME79_9PEZI|nr:hypothetical protein NA57DRAFT_51045 [Rhizodiscina lignyota]
MAKLFYAIAAMAALTIFSLKLVPREWDFYLIFLRSRIIRRTLGVPAPLPCDMPQSSIVPDTYVVTLASHHSLEEHKRTTGRAVDLERTISDIDDFHDPLLGRLTVYEAKSDDASLVNAIRADLGVLIVECEGRMTPRAQPTSPVQKDF